MSLNGFADRMRMHCLVANVNCKATKTGVSFTWEGAWEYDPMSGSGRATLGKDGRLKGVFRIEDGDSSTFIAVRAEEPDEPIPAPPELSGQVATALVKMGQQDIEKDHRGLTHGAQGERSMKRKPVTKVDSIEQEIEHALKPGSFISDCACFSFTSDLDEVSAKIARLMSSNPSRAVALYETFLAASYAKAEELDDSSGSFGQFVDELYCGWIKARQAQNANPEETASRLIAWMENDDYGFAYHLEKHAAEVLDKANLAAFVKQIRARFDAASKATSNMDGKHKERPEYLRRRWGEVLRTLYAARKAVAAYIALAEETGLTADDCHVIAKLLVSRRKPEDALGWVERGTALDKKTPHRSMAGHDLARLKRDILTRLGRGDEARDAAWADYRKHPSRYTYDDLMKFVSKAERRVWHEKAMDAASGAELGAAMELFLATKETERLVDIVKRARDSALEGLSHYGTEPVAKKLEKTHPDLAARLWRAQGMRVVNAKKSRYYDGALSNFERAKRCFERAGLAAEWQKTVRQVRADHHRKSSFMSGFERLVAGAGPSEKLGFLEQAKARWSQRLRG